ncbi:MAG: TOBE domain-containing protein, partial [Nitriliruptorales bacterium]
LVAGTDTAEVVTRMFSGSTVTYVLRLGSTEIVASVPPEQARFDRQDTVGVRAQRVHYLAEQTAGADDATGDDA